MSEPGLLAAAEADEVAEHGVTIDDIGFVEAPTAAAVKPAAADAGTGTDDAGGVSGTEADVDDDGEEEEEDAGPPAPPAPPAAAAAAGAGAGAGAGDGVDTEGEVTDEGGYTGGEASGAESGYETPIASDGHGFSDRGEYSSAGEETKVRDRLVSNASRSMRESTPKRNYHRRSDSDSLDEESTKDQFEEAEFLKYMQYFGHMDAKKRGFVSPDDIREYIANYPRETGGMDASEDNLRRLIETEDENKDGVIDILEYIHASGKLIPADKEFMFSWLFDHFRHADPMTAEEMLTCIDAVDLRDTHAQYVRDGDTFSRNEFVTFFMNDEYAHSRGKSGGTTSEGADDDDGWTEEAFVTAAAVFSKMDRTRSGFVTMEDVRAYQATIGEVKSEDELRQVMDHVDLNKDGRISLSEFMAMYNRGIPVDEDYFFRWLFQYFGAGTREVNLEQLRRCCASLGMVVSIDGSTMDGEGMGFDEFRAFLRGDDY